MGYAEFYLEFGSFLQHLQSGVLFDESEVELRCPGKSLQFWKYATCVSMHSLCAFSTTSSHVIVRWCLIMAFLAANSGRLCRDTGRL
jgi:hypothetical protein